VSSPLTANNQHKRLSINELCCQKSWHSSYGQPAIIKSVTNKQRPGDSRAFQFLHKHSRPREQPRTRNSFRRDILAIPLRRINTLADIRGISEISKSFERDTLRPKYLLRKIERYHYRSTSSCNRARSWAEQSAWRNSFGLDTLASTQRRINMLADIRGISRYLSPLKGIS